MRVPQLHNQMCVRGAFRMRMREWARPSTPAQAAPARIFSGTRCVILAAEGRVFRAVINQLRHSVLTPLNFLQGLSRLLRRLEVFVVTRLCTVGRVPERCDVFVVQCYRKNSGLSGLFVVCLSGVLTTQQQHRR